MNDTSGPNGTCPSDILMPSQKSPVSQSSEISLTLSQSSPTPSENKSLTLSQSSPTPSENKSLTLSQSSPTPSKNKSLTLTSHSCSSMVSTPVSSTETSSSPPTSPPSSPPSQTFVSEHQAKLISTSSFVETTSSYFVSTQSCTIKKNSAVMSATVLSSTSSQILLQPSSIAPSSLSSPPTSSPPTSSPPTTSPPTSPPTSSSPTTSPPASSPPSTSSPPAPSTMASPDSMTSDAVKWEKKFRDEMEDALLKLCDMSSWSTPEAAQFVKSISALYWNAEGHQQQVADAFCALQGAELFVNILLALTKEGLFSKNPTWQTAFYIYNTLWNLSDASLTLALRLGQEGMIKLCTTNISHKPYRDNMAQKNVSFLIKASLNILHNLAKAPGNKHVCREEKVVESMEPFLEGDPYLKAISMMTLAYIVEEGQEEILAEKGTNTIEYLVEILKEAQNSKDKRCQGLSDTEVTVALGRLAVHDNNKYKILEAGGLPLMISMLHDECVEAQEASANAVWNLAFSDDVSDKLRSNADCMQALQDLSSCSSPEVAKAANGALWVINKEGEKKDLEKETEDDTGSRHSFSRKQPHIMISYQWGSQPLVLKMRDALVNNGYKVWVDVDCMYGSTLQAMAEAIENACAIVMCMSERYKESPNCRTEAEYAFQLRKRIIPVMMEEYYRPDGWLGIILGAKFYMDFSGRLVIEEEMNKLLKEVQMHAVEAKIILRDDTDDGVVVGASITFPLESAGVSLKMESLDWSVSQVQDWLVENELEHLRLVMADYNGKLLNQLYKMRLEAPDFFYSSIKEDFGLKKLIDILRFTEALDSLLKD